MLKGKIVLLVCVLASTVIVFAQQQEKQEVHTNEKRTISSEKLEEIKRYDEKLSDPDFITLGIAPVGGSLSDISSTLRYKSSEIPSFDIYMTNTLFEPFDIVEIDYSKAYRPELRACLKSQNGKTKQ